MDDTDLHAEQLRESVDVSESSHREVERLSEDAAHDVSIVGLALNAVCALADRLASPRNDLMSPKRCHLLYV